MKCKTCKTDLEYEQLQGMRVLTAVTPPKPKHPYMVYNTYCPTCAEYSTEKAKR